MKTCLQLVKLLNGLLFSIERISEFPLQTLISGRKNPT